MNATQTVTKILATLAILLVVVSGNAAQRPTAARREIASAVAIA